MAAPGVLALLAAAALAALAALPAPARAARFGDRLAPRVPVYSPRHALDDAHVPSAEYEEYDQDYSEQGVEEEEIPSETEPPPKRPARTEAHRLEMSTEYFVGRALSFNKTPSKLKGAMSSMISPFGSQANLTPASQLAQMRLASCNNINLHKERVRARIEDVAIVRVEGLSPFPLQALQRELDKYANARSGNTTAIDQYPWLALIEYRNRNDNNFRLLCGGVLISGRYVLTAA